MTAGRALDYCAVRSLCGREVADEMFRRRLPPGFDIDHLADQALLDSILREVGRCDGCPDRHRCEAPLPDGGGSPLFGG